MKKTLAHPPAAGSRASHRLPARLAGTLGLLGLIAAASMIVAHPGHTAGGAVPVQITGTASVLDIDNEARQPFGRRFFPSAASTATFVVPAGKRLVITDIAAFSFGSTTVEDVAVYTTVDGVGTGRTIPFTVNSHGIVYASATLTDYADPGSTVTVAIDDTNSGDSAGMNVDVHGYYVNLP